MLKRALLHLAFVAAVVLGGYYLLPERQRQVALALFSDLASFLNPAALQENVEEKIEALTSTPAERRAELLAELKENLNDLKAASRQGSGADARTDAPELDRAIEESARLVEKLERANSEESFTNTVTAGIFDRVVSVIAPLRESSSTPADQNCR